jgi:hypothetical protein
MRAVEVAHSSFNMPGERGSYEKTRMASEPPCAFQPVQAVVFTAPFTGRMSAT